MKNDYYRGFPISEKDDKKINEWIKKQRDSHHGGVGAIGGRFTYKFTPTGIGTLLVVVDGVTGDKITIR